MRSPRLKVKWAERHINTLINQSAPLSRDLYAITLERSRSVAILAEPDRFDLRFVPKEPIPEFFALIMGDTIHNLRSSLDHWAVGLVSELTQTKRDTSVYFPFSGECKNLKTARGYGAIEKALANAADFIRDQIQPCKDGKGYDLWAVTDLDNIDKHNFILPTVTIVKIDKINATFGRGNGMTDCGVRANATGPINLIRSDTPIAIQNNFETSVEITFPKGGLFEDQPVIPTLRNLAKAVSETLNRLEEFLRSIY